MKKLRIGIVGCGKISEERHTKELATNPKAELVVFCDIVKERAIAMAEPFSADICEDYREVLVREDVDAVFVCCYNNMHAQISIDAMNAGKHVMCEKPMAISTELCEQMISAAEQNNCTLMVGHNQRLVPSHIKAREIICSKQYGDVITFRTTFGHRGCEYFSHGGLSTWFFKKAYSGFGACADLGVHKADLIRYLLGEEIAEVSAFAGTLHKRNDKDELIEVEDNAICLLRTESGKIGTLTASWTYAQEDNSTVIQMADRTMRILDDPMADIQLVDRDGNIEKMWLGGIQTNKVQFESGIPAEFVDAVLTGRKPIATGYDGLMGVKIIEGCLESARQGHTIRLK
jgi:predicted dehydrogenase